MSFEWTNGTNGSVTYNADGSAEVDTGSVKNEGSWRIQGFKWRYQGATLCEKWQNVADGNEH